MGVGTVYDFENNQITNSLTSSSPLMKIGLLEEVLQAGLPVPTQVLV